MNQENEKNISVTLKQNDDENDAFVISMETVFRQLKRTFSIWIVLAIVVGLITSASAILLNKTISSNTISSLVNFNYSGIETGLDPDGNEFDVNKIKAPNIIETALTNINVPLEYVEPVRRSIEIKAVMQEDAVDTISLYQGIYSDGGAAGLEAVNKLLEVSNYPSYYIVSFDNNAAGLDIETGKKIINEVLDAYQVYFFTTYGYNEALGNSVVAVDYTEYDYPAAVDIFKAMLDDLDSYTKNLQANDTTDFRSNTTGYNFSNIRRNIELIRTADLDTLSSYITINNVTNDHDQLITYYEYKIDELQHEALVLKTTLESITNSIDNYEKDSMLIFGEAGDLEETDYSQASEKYDELIEQKVEVQEEYSIVNQQIEYYKSRINTFKNNTAKNKADIEYVEARFSKLYDKINNLIDITTKTSDEFYENVVFANAFNILVPASGDETTVQIGNVLFPVIVAEAAVFVGYVVYLFISAIIYDRKNKPKKNNG